MVAVGDPVRTGLVAHLASPEGHLTGLTTLLPASMANRLHLLHTVVPGLARVAVYPLREFVEAGGLMAYGPNLTALYRRAAAYVNRLLRGAEPADLPIEPPGQYESVFHRQTARALGLMLPSPLIEQADEVFG